MCSDPSTTGAPVPAVAASTRVEVSESTRALHVSQVETHIKRLPPLSATIREILDRLRDVDSDMGWLEKHISGDPALATRLLKMANSTFYGVRSHVYTIPRALMTLGFKTSMNVLLAASVRSAFGSAATFPGFEPLGLTRHSVGVGVCADMLGRALPRLAAVADQLFVAGLLHDIGRVALSPLYARHATALEERIAGAPPSPEVEAELFGIDHRDAGEMVIRQWKLPEEFVAPIVRHHDATATLASETLSLGVRAADLYVFGLGYGLQEPLDTGGALDETLAALATDAPAVQRALVALEAESDAFLGAIA